MELIVVLGVAILVAILVTPAKKETSRKLKPVRVEGATKERGCSTCGGNCGQCGSSH